MTRDLPSDEAIDNRIRLLENSLFDYVSTTYITGNHSRLEPSCNIVHSIYSTTPTRGQIAEGSLSGLPSPRERS